MFRYKKLASRFGCGVLFFSVPKRFVKLAVNRNKLKRWFRVVRAEFFLQNSTKMKNNYVIIYSPSQKNEDVVFAVFKTELLQILQNLR
ncbi:MAG: Ribonuclease [Pseudomonadota bacterium]|jgi:ribonuclease P protein component